MQIQCNGIVGKASDFNVSIPNDCGLSPSCCTSDPVPCFLILSLGKEWTIRTQEGGQDEALGSWPWPSYTPADVVQ